MASRIRLLRAIALIDRLEGQIIFHQGRVHEDWSRLHLSRLFSDYQRHDDSPLSTSPLAKEFFLRNFTEKDSGLGKEEEKRSQKQVVGKTFFLIRERK